MSRTGIVPRSNIFACFSISCPFPFPKCQHAHHVVVPILPTHVKFCTSHTSRLLLIVAGHDGAAHAVLLDRQVRLLEVRLAALALLPVVGRDQLPQIRPDLVVRPPLCGVWVWVVGGVWRIGTCTYNLTKAARASKAMTTHRSSPRRCRAPAHSALGGSPCGARAPAGCASCRAASCLGGAGLGLGGYVRQSLVGGRARNDRSTGTQRAVRTYMSS